MAVPPLIVSIFTVHERQRGNYSFVIRDRFGFRIPGATLTHAKMSLYNVSVPPQIPINGRQDQNILQVNNVTIDALGKVLWDIQSADMNILDPLRALEPRIAVFELMSPTELIIHQVQFNVQNIPEIS